MKKLLLLFFFSLALCSPAWAVAKISPDDLFHIPWAATPEAVVKLLGQPLHLEITDKISRAATYNARLGQMETPVGAILVDSCSFVEGQLYELFAVSSQPLSFFRDRLAPVSDTPSYSYETWGLWTKDGFSLHAIALPDGRTYLMMRYLPLLQKRISLDDDLPGSYPNEQQDFGGLPLGATPAQLRAQGYILSSPHPGLDSNVLYTLKIDNGIFTLDGWEIRLHGIFCQGKLFKITAVPSDPAAASGENGKALFDRLLAARTAVFGPPDYISHYKKDAVYRWHSKNTEYTLASLFDSKSNTCVTTVYLTSTRLLKEAERDLLEQARQ